MRADLQIFVFIVIYHFLQLKFMPFQDLIGAIVPYCYNIMMIIRIKSFIFIQKNNNYFISSQKINIDSMSKAKGKDKKKDADSESQKIIEEQKREILEQSFTIKKLQDRLSRLTQQNYEIVSTKDKFHSDYQQKLDKNRILIQSHQSTIKDKSNKIYELEVQKINLINKVKNLQKEIKDLQLTRIREFDQYKRLTQTQISKLENQLKEFNFYMSQRDQMESQNDRLKRTLQDQKQTKTREVADKQRQKVQATDKLRDQMLTKIRDMRSNLLSLKKQQLSTTTRLAVLQNHQLTSQLQFQSKQSQKLIFQNQHLAKKVSNLQKDLQIHKQIQQQLAKRSHYSRGIIKKLTTKIGELQQELENFKKSKKGTSNEISNQRNSQMRSITLQQSDKKQQMIKALDRSLQYTQKKYAKLQSQVQMLKSQNSDMKIKIQKFQTKNEELIKILLQYYDEFIAGNLELKNQQTGFIYDLKSMRKRKLQQWKTQEVSLLVVTLLNKLANKVNRKNLGLPNINKNVLTVQDQDDLIPKIKFPRISQHSGISKLANSNINISSSNLEIKKLKDLPVNMASKIVASNVRQWGRTVHANSVSNLSRKYRIAQR